MNIDTIYVNCIDIDIYIDITLYTHTNVLNTLL